MCRRRALCSLSFFIVMILGEIFMGKNAGSVIVQKRNGKWQSRFYLPEKNEIAYRSLVLQQKRRQKQRAKKYEWGCWRVG